MFFGNVAAIEGMEKRYPAAIMKAIEYFKSKQNDFLTMEIGVYPIEGEDIFAQVINTETKAKEHVRPEVHRKYIDVQFSVEGKEIIGFAPDLGNNKVTEDLTDLRDVIFYDTQIENEIDLIMQPGSFTVLFPEDIHRPGCEYGGCATIRKVVIKVNTAVL